MEKLRIDRRLIRRRDWITSEELERELEAIPDSASKVAVDEDASPESPNDGEPGL